MKPEVESALYDWIQIKKDTRKHTPKEVKHLYDEYLKGYVLCEFICVECIESPREFTLLHNTVYLFGGKFKVKDHLVDREFVLDFENNDNLTYNCVNKTIFLCDYTDYDNLLHSYNLWEDFKIKLENNEL